MKKIALFVLVSLSISNFAVAEIRCQIPSSAVSNWLAQLKSDFKNHLNNKLIEVYKKDGETISGANIQYSPDVSVTINDNDRLTGNVGSIIVSSDLGSDSFEIQSEFGGSTGKIDFSGTSEIRLASEIAQPLYNNTGRQVGWRCDSFIQYRIFNRIYNVNTHIFIDSFAFSKVEHHYQDFPLY